VFGCGVGAGGFLLCRGHVGLTGASRFTLPGGFLALGLPRSVVVEYNLFLGLSVWVGWLGLLRRIKWLSIRMHYEIGVGVPMSVRRQLKGSLWFPLGRWGTVQVEVPARALGSFEGPRIGARLMLGRVMLMLLRFRVMTRIQLVV
jgi:hypothetical protein